MHMKGIPRRITVTSSLNEISTNQMGKTVVERVGGRRYSAHLPPLSTAAFWTDI
jgi:hypothetical protein